MSVIVDTNVLLYAADEDSRFHERSAHWLHTTIAGAGTVGFTWLALIGFVRIATNPRIMRNPAGVDEAFDLVDDWLAQPGSVVLDPTPAHPMVVRNLLRVAGTAGNLTSDAHLAAIALEHHAQICSFDNDFDRFGVHRIEP